MKKLNDMANDIEMLLNEKRKNVKSKDYENKE